MVDTVNLLPPSYGPASDPLLFGVASALEMMFPLAEPERSNPPSMPAGRDASIGDEAEAA